MRRPDGISVRSTPGTDRGTFSISKEQGVTRTRLVGCLDDEVMDQEFIIGFIKADIVAKFSKVERKLATIT